MDLGEGGGGGGEDEGGEGRFHCGDWGEGKGERGEGFGDVLNGGKGGGKDMAFYIRDWEWIKGGYEDRCWKWEKEMTRRILFLQDCDNHGFRRDNGLDLI